MKLLAALFLLHLLAVIRYGYDVPFADEWDNLEVWNPGVSAGWFFIPYHDHLHALTRLEMWILGRLGVGLHFQQILNFFLYGAAVAVLYRLLGRIRPALSPAWLAAFFVFLFSFLPWENRLIAFQSCITFVMLFFFLGVRDWFLDDRPLRGALWFVLSVFSFGSGLVFSTVALALYVTFRRRPDRFLRAGVPVLGAVAYWAYAQRGGPPAPHDSRPFLVEAPGVFLNLVSFGFGIDWQHWGPGLLCLLLVLAPLVRLWRARQLSPGLWALTALAVGMLANLALIAVARAGMTGAAKWSRYGELGAALVPVTACLWHLALPEGGRWRRWLLGFIWGIAFFGYVDDWRPNRYRRFHEARHRGWECLRARVAAGDAHCPTLYPAPLGDRWEKVKRYRPPFFERMK